MHIGIAGPIAHNSMESTMGIPDGTLPICLGGHGIPMLAKGLLLLGHTVSVYTLSKDVSEHVHFTNGNCYLHIGHYRTKHRARDLFKTEINEINVLISADKPDIVNAQWSYEFAMGALKTGTPTVVTLRDWAPEILCQFKDCYRLARLILNNRVLSEGKRFIANSPYLKKRASKKIKKEIPVIPNPIDDALFKNEEKTIQKRYRIISVNNGFCKRKNVKTLVKAFAKIYSELKNVELLLIGEEYEPHGKANRWVQKSGFEELPIIYGGSVSFKNLIVQYDTSDLLIHPSLEESFGNTLIEAMCRKVPIIGGESSGAVPWVLDHGNAGILVDVKDSDAIAAATIKILKDKKRWQFYSTAGYQNTFSRFKLSAISQQCVKYYESVLNDS